MCWCKAVLSGQADPWPTQQSVPQCSVSAASPFPALPQPKDQNWKGDQFHRANQNMVHEHSSSGVRAPCVELSSGRTTCLKYTLSPVGQVPTAHRAEDALAWRRDSHCLPRKEGVRRTGDVRTGFACGLLTPFSQGTDKAP